MAAEALECPTLLHNGFGEHNIQGIGDKHVPLIHNVMNTDAVVDVSDRATDQLGVLFGSAAGRDYLARRRGVAQEILSRCPRSGCPASATSSPRSRWPGICGFGPDDVVITVATDGAEMYDSERERVLARDYPGGFDEVAAAEAFGRRVLAAGTDDLLEPGLGTGSASSTSATTPGWSSRVVSSPTSRPAGARRSGPGFGTRWPPGTS